MSSVCHSYVIRMSLVCHSYVLLCHPYFTRMYSHVIRMSSVCYSYVLVCHPYVTCMSLGCTRMSSICHSDVIVCHSYVTRLWFYHESYIHIENRSCNYLTNSFAIPEMYVCRCLTLNEMQMALRSLIIRSIMGNLINNST